MPSAARPYWDALLAFTGYADDLADDPQVGLEARRRRYDRFVNGFFRILHDQHDPSSQSAVPSQPGDDVGGALCLAFQDFVQTWHIDEECLRAAHQAVRNHLVVSAYPTQSDLERYLHGACGQPTLWLSSVLELTDDGRTQGALSLGLGAGLLDCLVDLQEDLGIGKLYFPLEDLRRCGLRPADIEGAVSAREVPEPLCRLIDLQVSRARHHFSTAAAWAQRSQTQESEIILEWVTQARHALDRIAQNKASLFDVSLKRVV
ncbi:hypothetical protein ALMP_49940 [Streptomyces sp. A012304]|nr:hypothetical protein ALMP_49940 [Streptomyces sp. A012304]